MTSLFAFVSCRISNSVSHRKNRAQSADSCARAKQKLAFRQASSCTHSQPSDNCPV
jgi:hypothetical protein